MIKLVTMLAVLAVGAPSLYPVPEPARPEEAYPKIDQVPNAVEDETALFDNVKYIGTRNIHKCAIPMVVQVPNPCTCNKCTCCKCDTCLCDKCECCKCDIKTVNIKICVPPCDCTKIKHRRNGKKVIYDFGQHEVIITSLNGKIIVNYND